jgi:hypothetical protein
MRAGIKPSGSLSLQAPRKHAGKNWADVLPPHVTKEPMGRSSIAATMKLCSQVNASQCTRAAAVEGGIANAGKENDAQGQSGVIIAARTMQQHGDKCL